jgi:hypothetical protein
MKDPGDSPGDDTCHGAQSSGRKRRHPLDEQSADDGRAHPERPVGSEIECVVDAIGDEHAETERRENEADRRGPDQQVHEPGLSRPG